MTFDPDFNPRPMDPRFEPARDRYSSPFAALGFLFVIVAMMVGASFFFTRSANQTETAAIERPSQPTVTAPITQPTPSETTGSGSPSGQSQ